MTGSQEAAARLQKYARRKKRSFGRAEADHLAGYLAAL
jgi:hypothetical protein